MKKRKQIPVKLDVTKSGSYTDVINNFIYLMKTVTGGDVDVDIDLKGEVTIYFENDPKPKFIPTDLNEYDIEHLLNPDSFEKRAN